MQEDVGMVKCIFMQITIPDRCKATWCVFVDSITYTSIDDKHGQNTTQFHYYYDDIYRKQNWTNPVYLNDLTRPHKHPRWCQTYIDSIMIPQRGGTILLAKNDLASVYVNLMVRSYRCLIMVLLMHASAIDAIWNLVWCQDAELMGWPPKCEEETANCTMKEVSSYTIVSIPKFTFKTLANRSDTFYLISINEESKTRVFRSDSRCDALVRDYI